MLKINTIINIKKKTEEDFLDIANPDRLATVGDFTYNKNGMNYVKAEMVGFNQALDFIGDKSIELDENKIKEIMINSLTKIPLYLSDEIAIRIKDIVKALKVEEDKIIVEV